MNHYTAFAIVFGAVAVLLISSSTGSTVPFINCDPNTLSEAPAKIRQICYFVMEQLREQPQDNGDVIDNRVFERGTKRQDVDHVFLRFGRRQGL